MSNERFVVIVPNPLSVNSIYATDFKNKRRFLSKDGAAYRGEWKKKPIRPLVKGRDYVQEDKKGRIFIPGSLHELFIDAGVPAFAEKTKVIIEARATWPDNRARDMSNLQKPIEDALQDGTFIPNDCFLLWRNVDFKTEKGIHQLELVIYEKED